MKHHILENNEFQNKDERKLSSKKPFCGYTLCFGKYVFQCLFLVSHKGKTSQMPNLIIFITVFLPDILGKFLEASILRDSSFTHLFIRFSDSFLLKLYVYYARMLQNSQPLLRKMSDFNKHLANPASWLWNHVYKKFCISLNIQFLKLLGVKLHEKNKIENLLT